jgi:hypothetical protein
MPSRLLQDIQAGQGEIILEGSQEGCDETYHQVYDLSVEQVRADTPSRVASTTPYSGEEMGKYIHGIHYRPT